jgi:hypothetical protein
MELRPIEQVMDEHARDLIAKLGVVGVGIGECGGRPCIKVFVTARTPALIASIPTTVEGYDVAIEETGEFRSLGQQPPPSQ